MKLRTTFLSILALLVASFGIAAAQHGTDTATPSGDDHGDHHDHSEHAEGEMQSLSMGAFYLTITNNGDEDDHLVSVDSDIAQVVEIHNVEMVDGVMKMDPMLDGLHVPAGETIVFEPGSYHVMLIGINESLIDGEDFTATLNFENAGSVEVTVPIYALEPDEDEHADPVTVGDIEISNIWARQAPKIDGSATPVASPEASPAATPDHDHSH